MDQEILQYLHASLRICWFKAWLERSRSLRTHSSHSQPKFRMMQLSEPPPPNSPSEAGNQIPFFILWMSTVPWPDRGVCEKERERKTDGRTDRKSERVWVLAVFLEFPASNGRLSSWLELCQGTLCCTGAPGDKEERRREKKETLEKNTAADW